MSQDHLIGLSAADDSPAPTPTWVLLVGAALVCVGLYVTNRKTLTPNGLIHPADANRRRGARYARYWARVPRLAGSKIDPPRECEDCGKKTFNDEGVCDRCLGEDEDD